MASYQKEVRNHSTLFVPVFTLSLVPEFRAVHAALLREGFAIPVIFDDCLKEASRGTNVVNFNDFVAFARKHNAFRRIEAVPVKVPELQRADSALRAFLRFDTDVSSGLGAPEMRALLKTLGYNMSVEESVLIIKACLKKVCVLWFYSQYPGRSC